MQLTQQQQDTLDSLTGLNLDLYDDLIDEKSRILGNNSAPSWYTGAYDWAADYISGTPIAEVIIGGTNTASKIAIIDAIVEVADLDL